MCLAVPQVSEYRDLWDPNRYDIAFPAFSPRPELSNQRALGTHHDLSNPLRAIAMSAYALPQALDDAEIIDCGPRISRGVTVMERMISNLLDYTRTRLGRGMPVKPAPLNLAELGENSFEVFRAAHPDRDIRFLAEGDLHGLWDSDRVWQALSNLMGNAMQHGSETSPVTLRLWSEGPNVLAEVHNGGHAIPPAELATIFNPIVRDIGARETGGRKTGKGLAEGHQPGSIGMGLYIAREVAKAHDGGIDVISTEDAGTFFTLWFPREAAPRSGRARAKVVEFAPV